MTRRFSILLLVLACLTPVSAQSPTSKPPLGMNLSGVVDWSSELVFVDAFKSARSWISQAKGQPWGKGGPLATDARGHLLRLRPDQYAETVVWTGFEQRYPTGTYVCLYSGEGELSFTGDARVTKRQPGRLTVEVTNKTGSAFARVTRLNEKDPIRHIRLIPQEAEKTYQPEPFRRDFLDRWKGFKVFRFMDWQKTNNSRLSRWEERPTPDDHSQTRDGVALEYMIQLCNTLRVEPWFCMPHLADDRFVREFAQLVKKSLHPDLRIYVEYSNECWNGMFEQARHCARQGKRLDLSKNAYEAQLRYYSQRSIEIFKIWEEVFGGRTRLVRVLATQSANPWTGTTVLDWREAYKQADAVAIAPYFGNRFGDPRNADRVADMKVEDLLTELVKDLAESRKKMEAYAELARKRELQLLAYEGGQHLVGHGGAENNNKLTALFQAANRHPKMKDLYLADLKNWREAGGGLFCVFSSMSLPSKWGSWGVLEHFAQPLEQAPKMQALREYLNR